MADDGWQPRRFGDLATLSRNTVAPDAIDDCAYIGLEHIGEGTLTLLGAGNSTDVTSIKSRFFAGQILFGKLRPYFRKVVRPRFDGVCSTSIWVINATSDTDADFLFYLIASDLFVEPVVRASEGTIMPTAKWDYASELVFDVPRHDEQRAIGAVLRALDDKIELNRRMSETLEEMARALFKSWFVDFDPVRAKAEGRDPGLPKHLADLFPDRFVDSELGEIPEGWQPSTLGEHVENFDSKRVPLSGADRSRRQGSYPYHGAAGVLDHIDGYLFDGVHLLIGEDGSVLRSEESALAVTQYVWGKFWVNNHAHVLTGKGPVSTEQLYLYFDFAPISPYVTGAVQAKLSQGRMNLMPFVFPGASVCEVFAELVAPLFARLRQCRDEVKTLEGARDALLPKLVSGELRLPDLEGLSGP